MGDIRDDFQKLLVGRARVRCMIWDIAQKPQSDARIAGWLADMVRAYAGSTPDDFYLLAGYTESGFRFPVLASGRDGEAGRDLNQ